MSEARRNTQRAQGGPRGDRRGSQWGPATLLTRALDLGTNNCRLLIATPTQGKSFRVVEAYSRIVRLGEGLTQTGRMSDEAMERAMAALRSAPRRSAAAGCVQAQGHRHPGLPHGRERPGIHRPGL
jgi:exopolyphosphatase/guanosine-5'-triphosphate,3'-diphosphate pyrophosphatase